MNSSYQTHTKLPSSVLQEEFDPADTDKSVIGGTGNKNLQSGKPTVKSQLYRLLCYLIVRQIS